MFSSSEAVMTPRNWLPVKILDVALRCESH